MNREDSDIIYAERDADRTRFADYDPEDKFEKNYEALHPHGTRTQTDRAPEPAEEEAERPASIASSVSTVSVPGRGRSRHQSISSSRFADIETEFMHYLDRHPTAVRRIQDHRLQHSQTVGSTKNIDGTQLPSFGGGKPYPPPLPEREEYVVEFDGHEDPRHAQNWPFKTKLTIAAIIFFDSLTATFASSLFSPATQAIGKEFHKGREVVTLGTSLFVLGYALGPMVFAPISELYGRRLPLLLAAFGFGIFEIAVAVGKDYQTLMICRFFAGFFGSCPLTVGAACFADMFNNKTRGLAIGIWSATIINGPLLGPMVGGFITKSYLGWRWVAYIPAIMGFTAFVLILFFQKESYGPVILVSKAAELRRLTRNWGIHAKQEEVEVSIVELAKKNVSRPLRILFTEPIVLLVTIYLSFIYGLLYLSLTAYGIVFQEIHGFSLGVAGLPYFGMMIGVFIAVTWVFFDNKSYAKKLEKNNNIPVPEWRMPIAAVGGIVFAIGLFWFGWTGYTKSIPWIVPTVAGLCLGFGIYSVLLQCLNYLIDAYLMFAASALAANTIMRSLFGAIFPLWATYMFDGIGVNWGCTFLGCVALLFVPMPFIFIKYGKKIRARSKFAPSPDIKQDEKRAADEESGNDSSKESGGSKENGKEAKEE